MRRLKYPNSTRAVRWSSGQSTHLAFEVDSIDDFAKQSAAKGYPLSDGPHRSQGGGAIAFIDAPEGYEIELIAERGQSRNRAAAQGLRTEASYR